MSYLSRKQGDYRERSRDWFTLQPTHCMAIADYVRRSGTFLFRNQLHVKQTVTSQSSVNGLSNKPTALLTIERTPWKNPVWTLTVTFPWAFISLQELWILFFTLNGAKLSVIVVTARVEVDDHSAVFSEWQFTIKMIMLSRLREEWNLLFT